jgi:hypothetical protein
VRASLTVGILSHNVFLHTYNFDERNIPKPALRALKNRKMHFITVFQKIFLNIAGTYETPSRSQRKTRAGCPARVH